MPHAAPIRAILGKVTEKKRKGKALSKEIGKAFSPEAICKEKSGGKK